MRVGRIGIWIVLGMVMGALACSTAIPRVGPADAERTGLSMDTLRAGRDIYIAKCSGCHVLYAPQEYPDHVWLDQVMEMKGKALISERDVELILAYVRGMNGA